MTKKKSSTKCLTFILSGWSTKAVAQLIQNFNINPTYLFKGQGGMFLSEKAEIDELKEKVTFIEKQKNELAETVLKMQQMIA